MHFKNYTFKIEKFMIFEFYFNNDKIFSIVSDYGQQTFKSELKSYFLEMDTKNLQEKSGCLDCEDSKPP